MNRERIDPMIYEKPWSEIQGLAKLLVLETLKTPGMPLRRSPIRRGPLRLQGAIHEQAHAPVLAPREAHERPLHPKATRVHQRQGQRLLHRLPPLGPQLERQEDPYRPPSPLIP